MFNIHLNIEIFNDFITYFIENITCLLYIVDIWPYQTVYFTAIASLIIDISELFGSWFTFILLMTSTLTLLITIQQRVETYFGINTKSNNESIDISSNKIFCYKSFLNRIKF